MKMNSTLWVLVLIGMSWGLQAQSVMELKEKKAEIEAAQAEVQAQVDAYQGELDGINGQLDILGGWQKGVLGSIGFNFGSQSNWAGSANPNSSNSSLGIGITAYANSIRESDFWRNKGVVTMGWQQVDPDTNDDSKGTGFDLNTDLLNLSSLYGKNISDKWAISGLGELNSSVGNLFDPGTLDIGVGATWTPTNDLVVVIHPFNYHYAFSSVEGNSSRGSLGAKVRADYTHQFPGGLGWSSTLTSFIPYAGAGVDETTGLPRATLFEYTWLNNLTYTITGGIGVNLGFGLRNSEFESVDTQTYYTLGLSYAISK